MPAKLNVADHGDEPRIESSGEPLEPLNMYELFWQESGEFLLDRGYKLRSRYYQGEGNPGASVSQNEPPLYVDYFTDPIQTVGRIFSLR